MTGPGREARGLGHLLRLLRNVEEAQFLTLADWDAVLRLGRQARLLGSLYHRISDIPELASSLSVPVLGHLRAARNYSAHRVQMLKLELAALDRALPKELTVYLLKGASYVVQGLPMARGRLPGDVDLLVEREHLDSAEQSLLQGGWLGQYEGAYDQRYYRQWSHELPPMRFPGHPLEVDLHHAITPVTSRWQASTKLLLEDAWRPEGQRYWVLHPSDQIIHAAVHLMQDSDLAVRLRDLVDIDGLIRQHLREAEDWEMLHERVLAHGLANPVWYAFRYCARWLQTPVHLPRPLPAPSEAHVAVMDWLMPRTCLPRLPDHPKGAQSRIARLVAVGRYHYLRMPARLLLPHLLRKGLRRLWPARAAQ
jgi:hypothetical protein